ncbi:MAG: acyl-ACP thioesterase domain-containing protein [Lentisphaerota bacterium]
MDANTEQDGSIREETYTVRAYEVGPQGTSSLQTICNYLQEAAGHHARLLGVGIEDLLKQDLTWVLSRLHVQVLRFPSWREELSLLTWPSQINRLFACRDFELFDASSQRIAIATSAWLMLNTQTGRPVSIPERIATFHPKKRTRALEDDFDKLPALQTVEAEHRFSVRLSDLDMNRHVNNVNYIEWAVESVPESLWSARHIRSFEIAFRAAGQYGDTVIAQSQAEEKDGRVTCLHRLLRESDGKEMATARSIWV